MNNQYTLSLFVMISVTLGLVTVTPAVDKMTHGASFSYLGSLTASNGFHVLTFELGLEQIFENVNEHINRLHSIEQAPFFLNLSNYIQDTTITTRFALERSLKSVENLAKDILFDLSPQDKGHYIGKRGLFNAVGTTAEYLFGVATQSEIYQVTAALDYVNATTANVLSQVNLHATILNKLAPDVEALQSTVNSISHTLFEIANKVNTDQQTLMLTYEMLNADRLLSRLNSLSLGLRLMKIGQFAYEIISHEIFVESLLELETKGVQLLFSTDQRSVIYPHLAKIMPLPNPDNKNIRFAIVIPTNKVAATLDLFQLQTNYIFNSTMNVAFRYKYNFNYLGVNGHTHSVALLKSLENCRRYSKIYWCPLGITILNVNREACEIELYYQRKPELYCDVEITSFRDPIFTATKRGFYYSCANPTEIAIQCGRGVIPKTVTVEGNGEIKLKNGCILRHGGTVLFGPININQTEFSQHEDWIIIPEDMDQTMTNFSNVLEVIEQINNTGYADLDLGAGYSYTSLINSLKLLQSLRTAVLPAPPNGSYFEIVVGLMILLLTGCCLIKFLHCLKNKLICCCKCIRCGDFQIASSKAQKIKCLNHRMISLDQRTSEIESLIMPPSIIRRGANQNNQANEKLLANPAPVQPAALAEQGAIASLYPGNSSHSSTTTTTSVTTINEKPSNTTTTDYYSMSSASSRSSSENSHDTAV